jgi:hypothetical protein
MYAPAYARSAGHRRSNRICHRQSAREKDAARMFKSRNKAAHDHARSLGIAEVHGEKTGPALSRRMKAKRGETGDCAIFHEFGIAPYRMHEQPSNPVSNSATPTLRRTCHGFGAESNMSVKMCGLPCRRSFRRLRLALRIAQTIFSAAIAHQVAQFANAHTSRFVHADQ